MKTNRYSYLFDTDSYKVSHYLQYPENAEALFSYIESRNGGDYPETVFFGLQYYLKEYLSHRVSEEEVEEAKELFAIHGEPFNYEGWMYIARDLKGKLPVRIRAVPEGTVVPTSNILMSIESTDPKVFWIVSWLETMLLRVWYSTTVATRSRYIKKMILEALEKSADDPNCEIAFKLHDFGSRGVSSQESAMLGGAAHLINFMGTDTIVGMLCAKNYYNAGVAGFSIPAAEHSSITSWGKEHEVDAYRNMIKQFAKPHSLVAVVSDSYDIFNACKLWGTELKQDVISSGAILIVRPDSGNPPEVVLKCVRILAEYFGTKENTKGYRVLNNVRIIQGDGINEHSIKDILNALMDNGFSCSNVAFGMGGGLLQDLTRDTNRFAQKASAIKVNGEWRDVFKDPITDHGKVSKKGRLDLIACMEIDLLSGERSVKFETVKLPDELNSYNEFLNSAMQTVYENGDLLVDDTFEAIRARARS